MILMVLSEYPAAMMEFRRKVDRESRRSSDISYVDKVCLRDLVLKGKDKERFEYRCISRSSFLLSRLYQ